MPELPDILAYVKSLRRMIVGQRLQSVQVRSPFVLRSYDPPLEVVHGKTVEGIQRLGKRIVWQFDHELYLVFHLMIAGRFHWRKPATKPRGKNDLAAFQFEPGCLMLTEASGKKRAGLHLVSGTAQLQEHNPQGLEVLECSVEQFTDVLRGCRHTVKRALTTPSLFSGIGNAYSDEILHGARLSPFKRAAKLSEPEIERLFQATRSTLQMWIDRLEEQAENSFPEKVTAFRPEMAVHGKFGQPCPVCQTAVQQVVFSEKEMNYCPQCQTNGKVLADRVLSRLLR